MLHTLLFLYSAGSDKRKATTFEDDSTSVLKKKRLAEKADDARKKRTGEKRQMPDWLVREPKRVKREPVFRKYFDDDDDEKQLDARIEEAQRRVKQLQKSSEKCKKLEMQLMKEIDEKNSELDRTKRMATANDNMHRSDLSNMQNKCKRLEYQLNEREDEIKVLRQIIDDLAYAQRYMKNALEKVPPRSQN